MGNPLTPQRLLVLGGTGFVGREVCRRACKLGFHVTSLTRRGQLPPSQVTHQDVRTWLNRVKWTIGDARDEILMRGLVAEHDAIVHAIGFLFTGSLNKMLSPSQTDGKNVTLMSGNADTALAALAMLEEQERRHVPFAFVSAGVRLPFEWDYLTAKKKVEERLIELEERKVVRPVVLQPSIIYHHAKWTSLAHVAVGRCGSLASRLAGGKQNFHFPDPAPLDLVANFILHGISNPSVCGTFSVDQMWDTIEKMQQ